MGKSVQAVYFHVDMDAFYASVEQLDRPEYRGRPVVVGAQPGYRGVVSACSYEARAFGIRSAMPVSEAHRRCPDAVFLPVRMKRYQEVSRSIMAVFSRYTPEIQQISVDEAFLNMSGTERLFGHPLELGRNLKSYVKEETGLTISVGIAPNRYLAKLASACDKPDGLYQVQAGEEEQFVAGLELKDLWGIGEKSLERLHELNIRTVADLRRYPENALKAMTGKASGVFLYRIARGMDPGIFSQEPKSRSISSERTFEFDTSHRETLVRTLLDLSHQVMFRMLDEKYRSRTITLKIRFSDFSTTTVRKTLGHWLSSAEEVHAVSLELLKQRWDGSSMVRLIGLGLGSLEPQGVVEQQELFEDSFSRKRKLEQAILLMKRSGKESIVKASLLSSLGKKEKKL